MNQDPLNVHALHLEMCLLILFSSITVLFFFMPFTCWRICHLLPYLIFKNDSLSWINVFGKALWWGLLTLHSAMPGLPTWHPVLWILQISQCTLYPLIVSGQLNTEDTRQISAWSCSRKVDPNTQNLRSLLIWGCREVATPEGDGMEYLSIGHHDTRRG